MNPSSQRSSQFIAIRVIAVLILGLLVISPIAVSAQEVTQEPQVTPVTQQPVEVTATPVTPEPTPEVVVPTETTPVATPEPQETTDEVVTEVTEEPTVDEVIVEVTEDVDVTDVAPEATTEATLPPVEILEFNEDFEAFTGENWTIVDWAVNPVDETLALTSNVAGANASVMSLDWHDFSITLDAKIDNGNTLDILFQTNKLTIASNGRSRIAQGETILATSPAIETPPDASVTWHNIQIQQAGPTLSVTVDNVLHYNLETISGTPLGIFAFTVATDTGVIAVDNLLMRELTTEEVQNIEIISTPAPVETEVIVIETTEEPLVDVEVTEEPVVDVEATEEPVVDVEVTEEPVVDVEATEEPVVDVEVTEEPAPAYVVTNVITDDFEGDLSNWATTASIVEVAEGNHVLLMNAGGQLSPANLFDATNTVISGIANIMSNPADTAGGFTLTLSTIYTVDFTTSGVIISENGAVVAISDTPLDLNTWFTFSVESTDAGISVSVNDAIVAEYTNILTLDGTFSITSNTGVMFDDITVDVLTLEIEVLATPTPEELAQAASEKLSGLSLEMMDAFVTGGEEAVALVLEEQSATLDEAGRALLEFALVNPNGEEVALMIEELGGVPTRVYSKSIEAYVDIHTLIAVANDESIRRVRNISRAVSTGPVGNDETGSVPAWTEGYNLLSIEEWHLAGIQGNGVKIGVIDVGFSGAGGSRNGNLPCLASTTPVFIPQGESGLGSTEHGTQVIEVICDIAPSADVYMFRADDPASLQGAVAAARNPSNRMDVLLITLDLGMNTSAGGGVAGTSSEDPYTEIEGAKDDGIVVIAAAGNNNQRTLVLAITGDGATQVELSITTGDQIKFGWNEFEGASNTANFGFNLNVDGSNIGESGNVATDNLMIESTGNDTSATLTITPSSVVGTAYLQVQIVPNASLSGSQANAVKFGGILALGGNTTDITDNANVGNLARPADSDHVISVGASCARTTGTPRRWEFSSKGPRFQPSGAPLTGWDATITQAEAKPTLMSYAFVTVSDDTAFLEGNTSNELDTCEFGLGGTSSAAAHVAAMTALLMSNDANSSFADLNVDNATDDDIFFAIRDYLQSHSADMPFGGGANGLDTHYGSGLAILGAPTYDLNDTVNLTVPADLLPEICTTTVYVGQANLSNTTIDGSVLNPFFSIGQAMNAASNPNCVIVMPGEYVTPIVVDDTHSDIFVTGYDDVSRLNTNDVVLWLRNMYFEDDGGYSYTSHPGTGSINYPRRAGLYFDENSNNVEFSGFTFVLARFFTDAEDASNTVPAQAVVMNHSISTTVSNSQFGKINLNGVEYPGWNSGNASPVLILNQTVGGRVENNIFNENTATSSSVPTVGVVNSGSETEPITIIGNTINNNTKTSNGTNLFWGSVLYAEGSHIDIINNAFVENVGETIVRIKTTNPNPGNHPAGITATHMARARIVGNVFLNNQSATTDGAGNPGPIINAHFTPMMYIVNNTFVGNTTIADQFFGALIGRGGSNHQVATLLDGGSNLDGNANNDSWQFWEFHNNLIYKNHYSVLITDTQDPGQVSGGFLGGSAKCHRIPNDFSNASFYAFGYSSSESFDPSSDTTPIFANRGAQNNWIVGNTTPNGVTVYASDDGIKDLGNCEISLQETHNMLYVQDPLVLDNPADPLQRVDFIGEHPESSFTDTDWQYYALAQTKIDPDNSANAEYSDGVDGGSSDWLIDTGDDPYMHNADIDFDITETARNLDVNNWELDYSLTPPNGVSATDPNEPIDYTVDIGAFEFSPLQFETNAGVFPDDYYDADLPSDVNGVIIPSRGPFVEDSGIIEIPLGELVTGGFGEITFTIKTHPENYGTQCGPEYVNTKGLIIGTEGFNDTFYYCPAPDFYADSSLTQPNEPKFVDFEFTAKDEANATVIGRVQFTITPENDANLTTVIGDGSPADDEIEIITTLGGKFKVRLRPYVRFGNFFFSESGNAEFGTAGNRMIDYPFTYEITEISDPTPIITSTDATVNGGLSAQNVFEFTMADTQTGIATIKYRVRDARGNTVTDNIITIRSVSIIPSEGLFDDTSFIWNYSNGATSLFYTELEDAAEADVADIGSWLPKTEKAAINSTLHTTSGVNDTATFRFIGTGFTIYLRNGTPTGTGFNFNIFSDPDDDGVETPVFSTETWQPLSVNSIVNQRQYIGAEPNFADAKCTTRATTQGRNVRNTLEDYTITCNGLVADKHTVQIVNVSGTTLSVDAFSIINDASGSFDDANPIPPGFHDMDNSVLRNAFDGNWIEDYDSDYSNGFGLLRTTLTGSDVSFTITGASGFAIGTSYVNSSGVTFDVCVDDDVNFDPSVDGVCTTIDNDPGVDETGVHHPFFGLNPDLSYTVTLTNIIGNMLFDDLIVFDETVAPTDTLGLGSYMSNNTLLVMGEPFGDDWTPTGTSEIINETRSGVGPFITFDMEDDIDMIALNVQGRTFPEVCTGKKKNLVCVTPPPEELEALMVCVNRAGLADDSGENYGNCIVIDESSSNYQKIDDGTGDLIAGGPITKSDTFFLISELQFDTPWTDLGSNTVEIFNLYPAQWTFHSVLLQSSAGGFGAGFYDEFSPGIKFISHVSGTYDETTPNIGDGAFDVTELTLCTAFKKGKCRAEVVAGTALSADSVGNSILFNMVGTGFAPRFVTADGSKVSVCWMSDSDISSSDAVDIAAEIRDEAYELGGCQIFDNSYDQFTFDQDRTIVGLAPDTYHVLIELLASDTTNGAPMLFDGLTIYDEDWQSLTQLTTAQRYETSFNSRFTDNMFQYYGTWTQIADNSGTHSGVSYDETEGDSGASILFRTTGANVGTIIRDLLSSTPDVCPKKQPCIPGNNGFSPVTICIAPETNTSKRACSVVDSSGEATQVALPFTLNENGATGNYVVSIVSNRNNGFVIDAVELFDTTGIYMTPGKYEEDSPYITYEASVFDVMPNTSFENLNELPGVGQDWDWHVTTAVNITGTISQTDAFIGLRSASIEASASDIGIESAPFDLISGEDYTIIARVKVASTSASTVDMRLGGVGEFTTQTTKATDKWELLRFDFVAGSDYSDVQLQIVSTSGAATFNVDDVHVFTGGTWSFGEGGLTDGYVATSAKYGAKATFMFTGTGFEVGMANNTSSGEVRICYDDNMGMTSPHCFTYDNEHPASAPVSCGKKCTIIPPSESITGRSVIGLPNGTYYVTVQQMDNGLRTFAEASTCKKKCPPAPPLPAPNTGATSMRIDYVQIFDDVNPDVIDAGAYNEDYINGASAGMLLSPGEDWEQVVGSLAVDFTDSSYYRVANENKAGSTLALNLDLISNTEATVVIGMNQAIEGADQVLACVDHVDGTVEFNGTDYTYTDDAQPDADAECMITTQAATQTQLVFNKNNLPLLGDDGVERLFTLRSLTSDSLIIDEYQIIYGDVLRNGYYEEVVGFGVTDSILTISEVSTLPDWTLVSDVNFSGLNALRTSVDTATIDLTFEGTGISFLMRQATGKGISNGTVDITFNGCSPDCDGLNLSDVPVRNGAITVAGLPFDTYSVTLTANTTSASNFVTLDAIEVFGQLQELGSLYDDAQTDINGVELLTFGPRRSFWSAVTDNTSKFLNKTYHTSSMQGASLSFIVGADSPAVGIVIYDAQAASSDTVQVCWTPVGSIATRECSTVDLHDSLNRTTVSPSSAGNYVVSITNMATNQPMVIDAIQVLEDGIMAEGIYEEDYLDAINPVGTQVTNANATNGRALSLTNGQQLQFTFEGIAYSVSVVENSTNFHVCTYAGNPPDGNCVSNDVIDEDISPTSKTLSAVSYGGFHDSGVDGRWTVVITNNDATKPLLIDRVDVLGDNASLEIADSEIYESTTPNIRYLPFGSWTENSDHKDETPLNGSQHESVIPGSIAYFEFDQFSASEVGIEYGRQIQADVPETFICTKFKKGKCAGGITEPPKTPFNPANLCYGELGDPSANAGCEAFDNGGATVYQYSDSTAPTTCTTGCWGYVKYDRDNATDTMVTLDFLRLYEDGVELTAGTYQENHPNPEYVNGGGVWTHVTGTGASGAYYQRAEHTGAGPYAYFTFVGTGYSVRTLTGPDSDALSLCVYDNTGGGLTLPADIATAKAGATCLRNYDNEQSEDGFITHTVRGLHPGNYIAIVQMEDDNNDPATHASPTLAMGLDEIIIGDEMWYDDSDWSDGTYLTLLEAGNSYVIDFKNAETDKYVGFYGDWQTITEQFIIGYSDKKKRNPIFETVVSDRGMGSGTTALFRTDNANSVIVDIELGEEGTFQLCAMPVSGSPIEVDLTADPVCQNYTQTGRSKVGFSFGDNTDPHVVTLELLTDTYMSLYNIEVTDFTNGLPEGIYDDSAPAIVYGSTLVNYIVNGTMELNSNWDSVGTTPGNVQSTEQFFEGAFSRKITATTGQGVQSTPFALTDDEYYTVTAKVFVSATSAGNILLNVMEDDDSNTVYTTLAEFDNSDSISNGVGQWKTLRGDFYLPSGTSYSDVVVRFTAVGGQAVFYVDDVVLSSGSEWESAQPPLIPGECTGKGKKQVCAPDYYLYEAYGGSVFQSSTPGATVQFQFVGTGFEIGLGTGNSNGEVLVCYDTDTDFTDGNCFKYQQDDGEPTEFEVCTKIKKGNCLSSITVPNQTNSISGRGAVGLPQGIWHVLVRELDDGMMIADPSTTRIPNAVIQLDYVAIFDDTDAPDVDAGLYNESDADSFDEKYLRLYAKDVWQYFAGSSAFSQKTYAAPVNGTEISTQSGPTGMIQVEVVAEDEPRTVTFLFGSDSTDFTDNVMICVDDVNGEFTFDGVSYDLINSTNCKLVTDVSSEAKASINGTDIPALDEVGTHTISVRALTQGAFRLDGFQVFEGNVLTAGTYNENLPDPLLEYLPGAPDSDTTCDPTGGWCLVKGKLVTELGCIAFKKGKCKKTGLVTTFSNPFYGTGAAMTARSGSSMSFTAMGTGFSVITEVDSNGMEFRMCYKLASSGASFPTIGSNDEDMALEGIDADGLPILIEDGGILCEQFTTDTDNWSEYMDRVQTEGSQYGFSYYGLPLSTYEVQVMVNRDEGDLDVDDRFYLDAIAVFSDHTELTTLQAGLSDDMDEGISYEPDPFWNANTTTTTYMNTDSTSDNAGAIAQFNVDGNAIVIYQTKGEFSSEVQICLKVTNESIHCSVEAERQGRFARQVSQFTQVGAMVPTEVCVKFKKGKCLSTTIVDQQETTYFTPIVFYGLGDDGNDHLLIVENRAHGQTFNLDAIQVIP